MAKTYTLAATLNTGHLIASDYMEPSWSNFLTWNDAASNVGYAGKDGTYWYYATNMLFDQTTLSSLRNKVSNGIAITGLTLTVNCTKEMTGETLIGYKYNSTASGNSSSNAWTRCKNDGTSGAGADSVAYLIPAQTLSTGTQTFNLNTTTPYSGIPQYGLVAGPQTNVNGRWRFTSATLNVTTNEITVSYNKGANGSGTNVTDTITSGATLRGATFTRPGYTQTGWATSDGGAKVYNLSATYSGTSDLTLYPFWTIISYTVSYNVNGGSGTFANQTKNYGASVTIHATKPTKASASAGSYTVTYNANSGSVSPASASAAQTTNYTFSTWNTAQNGSGTSYAAGGTYSANASATLYAQYTSSVSTAAVTLPTPTRTNYTFNGWYTQASGGTRVGGAGSAYTPTGNVTLYAQWTASSATLSSVSPTTIDCGGTLTGNWTSTGPYYYWLRVTCGNGVGRWSSSSASGTGSLSLTVQIPTEWYTMTDGPMRDSDRATATCTLYTYSDSAGTVLVGTPSSLTFTAKVPDNVAPTLSSLTYTASSDNPVVSGWGSSVFVQGYSKVTLTLSVSSYNGSALKSVSFSGGGWESSGTSLTSPASTVVNLSGQVKFTAYCTDTRNHQSKLDVYVPFEAYSSPTISTIAVGRSDKNGNDNNSSGAWIKFTPSFSYSSCGGHNQLSTHTAQYTLHGSSAVLGSLTCTNDTTYAPIDAEATPPTGTIWPVSAMSAYDVSVVLVDSIQANAGTNTTLTTTLPTVQGIWFGKGNDRLGLGGVPEGAGLWCDWDATFKGVLDVVPRRCYNTLPNAGWYRVLRFDATNLFDVLGADGAIIDFYITRQYNYSDNEVHKITLLRTYNKNVFVGEESLTNILGIDKIRMTVHDGGNDDRQAFVDIHYYLSTENPVAVHFNVYTNDFYADNWSAVNFTSVGTSPYGETVVTEYAFVANTDSMIAFTPTAGSDYAGYGNCWYSRNGRTVHLHVGLSGLTANTPQNVFTMPEGFRPITIAAANGAGGSTYTAISRLTVSTDGTVQIISDDQYACVDITYLADV